MTTGARSGDFGQGTIKYEVKGIHLDSAKGYEEMVMARFREIGYRTQHFLINAADCGVPQSRKRVFFCALRNDIEKRPLELDPRHRWVSASEACRDIQDLTQEQLAETAPAPNDLKCWIHTVPGGSYANFSRKTESRVSCFNNRRLAENTPACTLPANTSVTTHWAECRTLTFREWKRLGSFPDDYRARTDKIGKYMIGMSVPPRMTETVARAVIDQWLNR